MENDNTIQNNSASQKVLEKIRAHELTMRPKVHFTLKSIALAAVAVIALLLSVSIGSFILFSIRATSETSLFGFGPPGYLIFLELFPWPLLLLDIACIAVLEWMLRKFRLGYKSPLLYLLFGILVLTLSATAVIDRSHASDAFLQGAHDHGVPMMGDLYDQGRRPPPPGSGACPCTVEAINGDVLTMQEDVPDGTMREVTVLLPPGEASSSIQIGDHLFVVGDYQNGVLRASGLQSMPHDSPPPAR